jgi:hypothetical protein
MAKRSQVTTDRSIDDRINAARADLAAAQRQAELVGAEENGNLATDEVYSSWQRRKRVADLEVSRRAKLLETLETDRAAQLARVELAAFTARWNAAAAHNLEVAEMMKT